MAAYYYGVELYEASTKIHDAEVNGIKVQIKISQQDKIVIPHEPEHLIVLNLRKGGDIFEVYNGPGKEPWECSSKRDSHNNRHMRINKIMKFDRQVSDKDRIPLLYSLL